MAAIKPIFRQPEPAAHDALMPDASWALGSSGRGAGKPVTEDPRLASWLELGRELLARGEFRVNVAIRAARVAALGGDGVIRAYEDDPAPFTSEEEEAIIRWFGDNVEEAYRRAGLCGLDAIWLICLERYPRSPSEVSAAMHDVNGPSDVEWVTSAPGYVPTFRAACEDYVRVMLAGAQANERTKIREAFAAQGAKLDRFAPFQNIEHADENPQEAMLKAMACFAAARTNQDVADAADRYAQALEQLTQDAALDPGFRLGFVAWLAHRGLKKTHTRNAATKDVSAI